MSHHIVETRDLHYTYPDGSVVLKGITFRITHGESVAVVGANGSGKSTLLLHLNGCLKPSSGEVRIGDFPISRENLKAVRRSVGMLFQDPDDQLFMPTVFEDVAFGPANLGLAASEIEERVAAALDTVRASHLKDRPPYKLSDGEKRLVSIASVLSMSPDILVMDEPTSNLDPRARRHLIELLKTFTHTKIIATHDMDLALELCGRTLVLHDGRIAADGATAELLCDRALLAGNGLEVPLSVQDCPICGRPKKGD